MTAIMSLADRRAQCERVLAKHPNTLPIVLLGAQKADYIALAPSATVADIDAAVREMGTFNPKKSVALTVDGCSPAANTTVAELYAACKNEDGFLYVSYGKENKLGMSMAGPCMAGAGSLGGGSAGSALGDLAGSGSTGTGTGSDLGGLLGNGGTS